MAIIKKRRKRITSKNIPAIQLIADEFEVGYKIAFDCYLGAKKYCKVFNDKTVLEETEHLINTHKSNFVYKLS